MFTLMFWRATLERSLSTAAQATVAVIGAAGLGVLDIDWPQVGSVAALAFVAAVLKAVAAVGMGSDGPGFGNAETLTEKVAAVEAHPAAQAEYQAGPAAHVPEGTAVHVVPDVNYRESVEDAVSEALAQPAEYADGGKVQATYHDPLDAPNEDYDPPAEPQGIVRHDT